MKNLKKMLVVMPLALCSAVGLAGCGKDEDPHTHTLTKTEAVSATCTTAGNTAYYTCSGCNKHYADEAGTTEVAENSWVVNALGHAFTDNNDHSCDRDCGHIRETAVYNIWDGTKADLPTAENNVYTITTAEQLAKLAELVNAGENFEGCTFNLTADINLNNLPWVSIGYGSDDFNAYFSGTFNGNNHTIYNLNVTGFGGGMTTNTQTHKEEPTPEGVADGTSGVGLFGATVGATIDGVKINTAVANGNHFVGALVGFALDTDINNCHVTNAQVNCTYYDQEESGDKAGIVAGSTDHNSLMTNCTASNGAVVAGRDGGQMVGCASINRADFVANGNSATNITVTHDGVGAGTNINEMLIGRLSGNYV